MEMPQAYLDFVAFHGLSWMSAGIKHLTRSDLSHIAIIDPTREKGNHGELIEAWNHSGGTATWWDKSSFSAHTPGTPYDIWRLPCETKAQSYCMRFYRQLAMTRHPYNWIGVIAFVIKSVQGSREGLFCSEGAITPLVRYYRKKSTKPHKVSPDRFVEIIDWSGGSIIDSGTTPSP